MTGEFLAAKTGLIEGRYLDRPAQARQAIEILIPPSMFDDLAGWIDKYGIEKHKVANNVVVREEYPVAPWHYEDLPSVDQSLLEEIKRLKNNSLVVLKYTLPGVVRSQQVNRRDTNVLFAGVIDHYDSNDQVFSFNQNGSVLFRRGVIVADGLVTFVSKSISQREIMADYHSPFSYRQARVPAVVVTQLIPINLGPQFEGFDEKALYDVIRERITGFRERDDLNNALKLRLYESKPDLLQQAETMISDSYLEWISKELAEGGETTYKGIEAELEGQLRTLHERLANLDQEQLQYLADLEFTKAILEALKVKSQKAPLRTTETLRVGTDLREIFKNYGFELSAVNPLFFPYYRQVILTIAENQKYNNGEEKVKHMGELAKALEITPENIIDAFAETKYDSKHITPVQALFTSHLDRFLVNVPEDKKNTLVRRLKRLYAKYFHPDSNSSPFKKDTAQMLFKVGFTYYDIFETKFS